MNDRLRLAELLATRLCHDLSGPVGTLMGALAMAGEDPDSAAEAIELASDVVTGLGRRLRLLRAAWGGAGSSLSLDELSDLCQGLPQAGRVKVGFENLRPGGRIPAEMVRLLLNVLMLAVESLPGGGAVAVGGDPLAAIMVRLEGSRGAWPAHFASWVVDPAQAWAALDAMAGETARGMQGPLTALVAADCGIRLGFLMGRETESAPPLILSRIV